MEDAQYFSGDHTTEGSWLNGYQKDIPDPAKVEGSKVKINTAFEAVFNQLKQRIEKELLS